MGNGMRRGAVAIVDALGFRGIWRRYEADVILGRLKGLAATTADAERDLRTKAVPNPGNAIEFVQTAFLSDSVAIAVALKDPEVIRGNLRRMLGAETELNNFTNERLDAACLTSLADMVGRLQERALLTEPRLMYRGCIGFGAFAFEDNFLVGEAVDEAAAGLDAAQGAFVWMAPAARTAMLAYPSDMMFPMLLYPVPLKGGDTYKTFCVVPFKPTHTPQERVILRGAAAETFMRTRSIDVAVKAQNTLQFLDAASNAIERGRNSDADPNGPSGAAS
jgi:hypothetical protein